MHGQTEEAKQRKQAVSSQAGPIEEEEFFTAVREEVRAILRALVQQLRDGGYEVVADRMPAGARRLRFVVPRSAWFPFSLFTDASGWFAFEAIPSHHLDELKRRLRDLVPSRKREIERNTSGVSLPSAFVADSHVAREVADVVLWMRAVVLMIEGQEDEPTGGHASTGMST